MIELLNETPPFIAYAFGFTTALALRRTVLEGVVATQLARFGVYEGSDAENDDSDAESDENRENTE